MRLPFLRSKDPVDKRVRPAGGNLEEGPVQLARTRARRRLIGALVLLAAGVLGFPMLFETRPRPLPVDTPILVPETAVARAVSAPAPRPPLGVPPDAGNETVAAAAPAGERLPAAAGGASGAAAAVAAPASAAAVPAEHASASAAAPKLVPVPKPPAPAPAEPGMPAEAGRFVVQVGAYNDVERMRAARSKLESLGYKTYTQDVDTSTGKRTRVRVGPFPSRQDAEKVAAKVKSVGMQANILEL